MDEVLSYYWAETIMTKIKYDSLINKIPIVFLTEEDIRSLLIEQDNLTDLSAVEVVRIHKNAPYSPSNIRLEIK